MLSLISDSSRSETESGPFQTLEAPSYRDYRAEAFQHYKQRDECFKKAALAFSKKQGQLAQFYAQQVHVHIWKVVKIYVRVTAPFPPPRPPSKEEKERGSVYERLARIVLCYVTLNLCNFHKYLYFLRRRRVFVFPFSVGKLRLLVG